MPVSTTVVPVTPVATANLVAPGQVIPLCGGMACGKIGKHGPAVRVEALDGRMSEQALKGDLSFQLK
jgi:hypothetical protein